MAKRKKKELPIARKIRILEKYGEHTAFYDLSKTLKDGKTEVNYLIISRPKPVSGLATTTIWSATESGNFLSTNPIYKFKGKEVKHWLQQLGYNLINA